MKIAIIGAGQMARIIAENAKKKGFETHCFAWEDCAVAKSNVDVFHAISIFEIEKIAEVCSACAIDGVIATTELTIAVASKLAARLGLPGIPVEVGENITHKNWVRDKVGNATLMRQPAYQYLPDELSINGVEIGHYPVIVKPVGEGGKRGVTVVKTDAELVPALQAAFVEDKAGQGVLIEEFLSDGKEYSVESLSFQGRHQVIQVTEKISSGPPHCVELGHSQPAFLSDVMRRKVIAAVTEVLDKVGYTNGASHCEVKIMDGEIYLIELNARPGGDHISYPLTELSTGYDFIGEAIHIAGGIQPFEKSDKPFIRYAGVRFVSKQTDYLKELFDTCDQEPWLYEKNKESGELREIEHNDCYHTDYLIYCSDRMPKALITGGK